MSELFKKLTDKHIQFINKQHMYFIGTAGAEGLVNISPKGLDSIRVLSNSRVIWLNLTGSGNETAAHVLENGRMTIMFCSYDKQPLILRLYGNATVTHVKDQDWNELADYFPGYVGARQIFDLNITQIQTSCGFGVPVYTFKNERPTLDKWAKKRGKEGIKQYWTEKNTLSLDGKDTKIV